MTVKKGMDFFFTNAVKQKKKNGGYSLKVKWNEIV